MKFLVTIFLSLFIFFVVVFSFPVLANAQSATSEAKFIKVSYDLPFPGILPDNPLYFLKALRDNLMKFLITDPLKKAEYDLLMADKRLVSAESLANKGNYQLAITTLGKSGNYFDEAIQLAAKAKDQKLDARDILNRLFTASQKHQLIIYQVSQKTKGDVKYQLELMQVRVKNFQDTVDVIRSQ
jgi:hypothetical protein